MLKRILGSSLGLKNGSGLNLKECQKKSVADLVRRVSTEALGVESAFVPWSEV